MKKRLLAVLTTVIMIVTLLPATMVYGETEAKESNPSVYLDTGGITAVLTSGEYQETITSWGTNYQAGTTCLRDMYDSITLGHWDRPFLGWQEMEPENFIDGEVSDWIAVNEDPESFITTEKLMTAQFPEGKSIKWIARWGGDEREYFSNIRVQSFDGTFHLERPGNEEGGFEDENPDGEEHESFDRWDNTFKETVHLSEDETFGAQMEGGRVFVPDEEEGYEFDGWVRFLGDFETGEFYYDECGTLTTEEMLAQPVPESDAKYILKWKHNDLDAIIERATSNDSNDEGGEDEYVPVVGVNGEGGRYKVGTGEDSEYMEEWAERITEDCSVLGDYITISSDPIFWDPTREFRGWQVFREWQERDEEGDMVTREELTSEDLYATEDLANLAIPADGSSYYIRAAWEGDDSDYYSIVSFNGYGGDFKIGQGEDSDYDSRWTNRRVKKIFDTYAEAIGEEFKILENPSREEEEFVGWLRFTKEVVSFETEDGWVEEERYKTDGTTYTFDEIMAQHGPKDGDAVYLAKYSNTDIEKATWYVNEEYIDGEGGDDEGGEGDEPSVAPDCILVDYWRYGENGEYEYTPLIINVDGESTYRQLFQQMEAQVVHYAGLNAPEYEYFGSFVSGNLEGNEWEDSSRLDEIAVGGLRLNARPHYSQWLIKTEISYYDENGEAVTDTQYVPVNKIRKDGSASTYQDVYVELELPDLRGDENFNNWDVLVYDPICQPDEDLESALDRLNKNGNIRPGTKGTNALAKVIEVPDPYYDNGFKVMAAYDEYHVDLTYHYLNEKNEVITKILENIKVPANKSYAEFFAELELTDSYVAVDGMGQSETEYGIKWQIGPAREFDIMPRADITKVEAAAQYADRTPAYFSTEVVVKNTKWFDGRQYDIMPVDKVVYVDEQPGDSNDFEMKVLEAITAADTESCADFIPESYRVNSVLGDDWQNVVTEETVGEKNVQFLSSVDYSVIPNTENSLLQIRMPGGKLEENIVPAWTNYDVPYVVDNFVPVWEIAAVLRGGNSQMGGFGLKVEPPFMSLTSVYSIDFEELTKAPKDSDKTVDQIKDEMMAATSEMEGFEGDDTAIDYYDVSLNAVDAETGEWNSVADEDFPVEGVTICLPFPEGTADGSHIFCVTHYVTSDNDPNAEKDTVEYLEVLEITEEGIIVKADSLSPIAIAATETPIGLEFSKLLNEDGKVEINSVPPENYDEFMLAVENSVLKKAEEYGYWVEIEPASESYPFDRAEMTVHWDDGSGGEDGPGESFSETHEVELIYIYDESIKEEAEKYVSKMPNDGHKFQVKDMELINYWVNEPFDPEGEGTGENVFVNYSSEYKKTIDYSNFDLFIDSRAGDGGPTSSFYTTESGMGFFMFDGVSYKSYQELGAVGKHILYVPDGTEEDPEVLREAIQSRIDEYIGEGIVTVSIDTISPQDDYDKRLDDMVKDHESWGAEVEEIELQKGYYKMKNEFILDAYADTLFIATIDRGNGYVDEHRFIVMEGTSNMLVPEFKTKDVVTDIEINSEDSSIPLDTAIDVEKLEDGEEYENIIKLLGVTDHATFNLTLFSKRVGEFITKLENGTFQVRIPMPKYLEDKDVSVYYVNDENRIITYPVTVEGGYAVFTTDHFSIYTLAEAGAGVEKVVAVNDSTGEGYADVTEALDAAVSGETVRLVENYNKETLIVVPSGITFDLNGKVVKATDFLSYGNVIDTADTQGGVSISNNTEEAFVLLQPNNTYLPVYDTVTGCYKFFAYEFKAMTEKVDDDSGRLYTRFQFTDDDAYKVIAETEDSGLTVGTDIMWAGLPASIDYAYKAGDVKNYAQQEYDSTKNKTITLHIYGLTKLETGTKLILTPYAVTKSGVKAVVSGVEL